MTARHAALTHCPSVSPRWWRKCRACNADRQRERYKAHRRSAALAAAAVTS